ncbi:MAG: DUF1552 domain-containing protein, partial [Verrucomicrobiota bacterium]
FLRGMGALVALPFMESLVPARALRAAESAAAATGAAPGPFPMRSAFVYIPNGVDNTNWWPTEGEGANYTLNRSLSSLEPFKQDFQIISGLDHHKADANGDGGGDHARAGATYLTGCQAFKTGGRDIRAGTSIDQVIANGLIAQGAKFRLPSLELSCDAPQLAGVCDTMYSCAYQYNLSWRSPTQPNPAERNPRLVFERMFGSGAADDGMSKERRAAERASILDFVRADAKQLQGRLGRSDQQKLDEYFTSVREIERRIVSFESMSAAIPSMKAPVGIPHNEAGGEDYPEHIRLMMDLLVLAFQTNSTPIITLMLASESSPRTFPWLGIGGDGHHPISHHQRRPEQLAKLQKIDQFYTEQFAYLLGKMKGVKEGDRTLLDNTLLVYGSCIRDGDKHDHADLPTVMAGRAGGQVKTGRFNVLDQSTPMSNFFIGLAELHGVHIERHGDSTGKLSLAS